VLAELRDRTYAERTKLVNEYHPEPPFDAGSLKTSPSAATKALEDLLAGFKKQADALAATRSRRMPAAWRAYDEPMVDMNMRTCTSSHCWWCPRSLRTTGC